MLTLIRTTATIAAALTLAACGGSDEERLTRDEYRAELQPQIERISAGFGSVFEAIGRAEESDRVSAEALRRLGDAAAQERRIADEMAELRPPERLEDPTERLVAGARRQATDLERLASADGAVTVAQVADAIEQGASVAPLRELGEAGVVEPPGKG